MEMQVLIMNNQDLINNNCMLECLRSNGFYVLMVDHYTINDGEPLTIYDYKVTNCCEEIHNEAK